MNLVDFKKKEFELDLLRWERPKKDHFWPGSLPPQQVYKSCDLDLAIVWAFIRYLFKISRTTKLG